MNLENYISDLLYRYECVIVPNLGGFVTNETSAKVNHFTHTFYPPTKKISFNSYLKHNDGLLANYISSVEKIPFSEAVKNIQTTVNEWNFLLENEAIEIAKIGTINLNKEKKIVFEPSVSDNYLTSSFGLNSFYSPAVKRLEYAEKVRQLETVAAVIPTERKTKKTPLFLKYAAAVAIVFTVGSFGWKTYNDTQYQNQLLAEQLQQDAVDQKIQQATFVIENPLPTITLTVAKEIKNYHVIAGAFREPSNADKKVHQLIEQGFDAQILGVNKWNLTQVSYASYSTRAEALVGLKSIKKNASPDAWLLIHKF
ncbi:MAG: SPOR domain-containing protein [Urechidicola sp.]|nr:SPOR domain-containing protein [Urechidicola sp.]